LKSAAEIGLGRDRDKYVLKKQRVDKEENNERKQREREKKKRERERGYLEVVLQVAGGGQKGLGSSAG
jgi:hypothetical protein